MRPAASPANPRRVLTLKAAARPLVFDRGSRTLGTSAGPSRFRPAWIALACGAFSTGSHLGELRRGDVLLIAGKGHETGQIIGKQTLPFSDHEAVAAALEGRAA